MDLPTDRIDGKSILPLLKGETNCSPHDYLVYINSTVPENQGSALEQGTISNTTRLQTAKMHSMELCVFILSCLI